MNLTELPYENLLQFSRYLKVADVKSLAQTCHNFNIIYNDQIMWKMLVNRDFRKTLENMMKITKDHKITDWKRIYLIFESHPLMHSEVFNIIYKTILEHVGSPKFVDILPFKTSNFPFYDNYGDVYILAPKPHKQWKLLSETLRQGNISAHFYDVKNIYVVQISGIIEQGEWMPENLNSEYD